MVGIFNSLFGSSEPPTKKKKSDLELEKINHQMDEEFKWVCNFGSKKNEPKQATGFRVKLPPPDEPPAWVR